MKSFKKVFNMIGLMIALLCIRIFEFIMKLISIKGFIFMSVFYLYLNTDKVLDIYALVILAGWLAEIRRKEKTNVPKFSLNKEGVIAWVSSLKDRFISKVGDNKETPEA